MKLQDKVLEIALAELAAGHGEEGDNNGGQWVKMYLNGLCEPPANWCSAYACFCIKGACKELGVPMPIKYTLSARNLMNQLKAKGKLLTVNELPLPGDLIFYWRDDPSTPPIEPSPWMGHVEIFHSLNSDLMNAISGNRGKFPSKVRMYPYLIGPTVRSLYAPIGISLDNRTMGFLAYGRLS